MLTKKFGKRWNKNDDIDACDFRSSTQFLLNISSKVFKKPNAKTEENILGDMVSSDNEEEKSTDDSSGDEETSDTLDMD